MKEICLRAGLGVTELALVESYIADDDGRFIYTDAYEKLFNYFCDEGEMPLEVAKAISLEPDIWILDRLASCNLTQAVV
jgi:hypothetical protein|tara:strand:- start:35 stop:271 length:237 start_codon:yes stop_codon:yes gene_type:complete